MQPRPSSCKETHIDKVTKMKRNYKLSSISMFTNKIVFLLKQFISRSLAMSLNIYIISTDI